MKFFIFSVLTLFITAPLIFAQEVKHEAKPVIYIAVEEMPEFPGGNQLLGSYVAQNFNLPSYPTIADSLSSLSISFVIGPKGEVYSTEIFSRVHPAVDQEGLRVIKSMPAWKPGKQDGKPVYVKYTVPIKVPAPRYIPSFLVGKSPFVRHYNLEEYESGVSIGFIDSLEFPGGNQALKSFIKNQHKPKTEAIKQKVSGVAKISFLLNHKGEVSQVKAISNLGFGIEESLVEMLNLMPNWKMGHAAKYFTFVKRTMEISILKGKATFKEFVPSEYDRAEM